jgi:hypothetical protein
MRHTDQMRRHGKEIYKIMKPYRVNVPTGKSGPWAIYRFDTEVGIEYARLAMDGRDPGLGKFTGLSQNNVVIMSDTVAETRDMIPYLYDLQGDVLITGLGIGQVVHCLVKIQRYSEMVKSITVIEKSKDVIKLSADHYRKMDKRVRIINADAFEWLPEKKGKQFDAAWHDIWPTICGDNKPEFMAIRKHYRPFMRQARKQFCWGESYLRSRGEL